MAMGQFRRVKLLPLVDPHIMIQNRSATTRDGENSALMYRMHVPVQKDLLPPGKSL